MKTLRAIGGAISAFFSAVPTAVSGKINAAELLRSIFLAVGASSVTGVLLAVMTSVSANAAVIFPDKQVATAVVAALTFACDVVRRYQHAAPAPALVAQAAPAPAIAAEEPGDVAYLRALDDPDHYRIVNQPDHPPFSSPLNPGWPLQLYRTYTAITPRLGDVPGEGYAYPCDSSGNPGNGDGASILLEKLLNPHELAIEPHMVVRVERMIRGEVLAAQVVTTRPLI